MARLRYNGLVATLGGSLTSGATSVTFAAALTHSGGAAVPTITGSDYIPLAILDSNGVPKEIVHLTAYTAAATTGTIARGKESTTGVAHASAAVVLHGPSVEDVRDGTVLACISYNPGTLATLTSTSTTLVDVDATNLAITFVAPQSGRVEVTVSALGGQAANGSNIYWGLRSGSTTVGSPRYLVTAKINGQDFTYTVPFTVSGLTPGTSYTYKWGHYTSASGTAQLFAGGVVGEATMKVTALPAA